MSADTDTITATASGAEERRKAPEGTNRATSHLYCLVSPEPDDSMAETEAPNSKGLTMSDRYCLVPETEALKSSKMTTSPCCSLGHVRLGKHERRILLAQSVEFAPFEEWNSRAVREARKTHAPISRAINRLARLKLIEDASRSERIPERHEAAAQVIKRRDKRGFETTYSPVYMTVRYLRLTPLGAAVVDQFRDALASGKRIRWSRFKPPPEPPVPPEPEPVKVSPEQEELSLLKNSMCMAEYSCELVSGGIERARDAAAQLPHLEERLRDSRFAIEEMKRRIAELEAEGVTLPPSCR
jgi:hypothetical protein